MAVPASRSTVVRTVTLDAAGARLYGDLGVPANAVGLVVFAHGSGSSRFSSRNRAVAEVLTYILRTSGRLR